jgi:hypothetical protein
VISSAFGLSSARAGVHHRGLVVTALTVALISRCQLEEQRAMLTALGTNWSTLNLSDALAASVLMA